MQKKIVPYPGKISVAFRKGPLGYLPRDSSKEARRIKNVPELQDKSAPVREDDALTVIYQRGGDASDMKEVQGEDILQFGKYKGKSFQWLLENECRKPLRMISWLALAHEPRAPGRRFGVAEVTAMQTLSRGRAAVKEHGCISCSSTCGKKQQSVSASTNAPTKPLGMDEDKDLEDAMLSISPVKLHMQSFTVPAAAEGSTPRGSSGANTGE
ncbi:unnamed protein product [Oreochromis niloticus]|nr:unnamed protein product [Mustela putorius furo]